MAPTASAAEALRRLRHAEGQLREVASSHQVTLLVAFGSAASGAAEGNDVDLAVKADAPLDVLQLQEELYQLTGYEGFDVMDLCRAGVVATVEALRDPLVLVEDRIGERNELLVHAWMRLVDTQWLRDVQLEVLAQ